MGEEGQPLPQEFKVVNLHPSNDMFIFMADHSLTYLQALLQYTVETRIEKW